MSVAKAALEQQLSALRERFLRGVPDRIRLIEDGLASGVAICDVERLFHSLAGTAATHRLDDIASIAREGEELCGADVMDRDRVAAVIEELGRCVRIRAAA